MTARNAGPAPARHAGTIEFDAVTKRYPGVGGPVRSDGRTGARGARVAGGTEARARSDGSRPAGASAPTAAVESFSLTVQAGTTTVLLGSSGCGKTTLLRMVNRMVEPTSGRVLVDGQDVSTVDAVALRRSIGYVMQNAGLLPHRRVLDNITLVPRLEGVSASAARDRAAELMDLLGLDPALARRYPHELSGGQAQRVGVARALAADPAILLMDEPFGAVDPLVRRDLQRELLRIQGELAKTILFVTHDVDEALTLGDEILLLREGAQIAQRGTGPDLVSAPADDFVARFLGLDDADRALRVEERAGRRVVLDASGRAIGRLGEPSGGLRAPAEPALAASGPAEPAPADPGPTAAAPAEGGIAGSGS